MEDRLDSRKIIPALDQEDPHTAMRLVDTLLDQIDCFKIGPVLFTRSGPAFIDFLHSAKKQIFVDLKLYDTPRVVADTIKQYCDLGVHYATVHTQGGPAMLEAASRACRGYPLKLLGVTLMTSQSAVEPPRTQDTDETSTVVELANLAVQARLAGVLCSAFELRALRSQLVPSALLVCAGIRIPDEEIFQEDQKRTASAREAIDAGADLLIVGRPLHQSPHPIAALDRLTR